MEYNKEKHLKILLNLLNCNSSTNRSYLYNELKEYEIVLQDFIFWKRKKDFVVLMKNFIKNLIEFEQFEIDFSGLWNLSMKEFQKIKRNTKEIENLELNSLSTGFCSQVTCIFRCFDAIQDEYMNEVEFKEYTEGIFETIKIDNDL